MPPTKEWAWSYSKLKNFETCPKRHYEVDVLKNFTDEGDGLAEGNAAHKALADACSGKSALPSRYSYYQPWVDGVTGGPGELMVEQKYAITRDFQPTAYFAPNVWYRGIGDVVRVDGPAAVVLDWKTGKILEDSVQLFLMAACLFAHYPQLEKVGTSFIWLREDCETRETFTRKMVADEWMAILPRVAKLENASKDLSYPPKPGGLCKRYCPVTSCPYHGKGLTR